MCIKQKSKQVTNIPFPKHFAVHPSTSGIADADVTPEGRAVSVSQRGDEIRVWDLEGRQSDVSVEVRPREGRDYSDADDEDDSSDEVEHRRNWVGTDDHRVTVLRETSDGAESLVTYDFT